MITIKDLVYHSQHTGGKQYQTYFRLYIKHRYDLPVKNDTELLIAMRRTSCLLRISTKGLPGAYDINLAVHARNIRKYYKIHKSKEARNAYLMIVANRDHNYVIDFNYVPEFFHQN